MGAPRHELLQYDHAKAIKNAYRMIGLDLGDVSADRYLPPDGLAIVAELWRNGATVPEIMAELNLSEAAVCRDLMYLELKGRVTGFILCLFDGVNVRG